MKDFPSIYKLEKNKRGKTLKKYIIILCSACLLLSLLIGCGKSDPFAENNEIFFRMILNRIEQDEVEIESLDAYKVENKYYYHVIYSYVSPVTNEWTDADLVYFGSYQIDRYFSFAWDDFGDMEKDRKAYFEAVEKGEHKSFSQEEIQQYVNAFYDAKQESENE